MVDRRAKKFSSPSYFDPALARYKLGTYTNAGSLSNFFTLISCQILTGPTLGFLIRWGRGKRILNTGNPQPSKVSITNWGATGVVRAPKPGKTPIMAASCRRCHRRLLFFKGLAGLTTYGAPD